MTLHVTADDLAASCASTRWVQLVLEQGPFDGLDALRVAADIGFDALGEADWLEAFAHHPRIGDVADLRARFAASGALSQQEQSGLDGTDEDVLVELAAGNVAYEQRFGFVFLVRAAGRSARDMLAIQRERLGNDRSIELRNAADQQREITHLRLERLQHTTATEA